MANNRKKFKGKNVRRPEFKDKQTGFRGHNCDNDVSWYKQYPKLVEASSSIIFNVPYGGNYYPIINGNVRVERPHSIVPGAVGLGFDTYQVAKGSNTDPVNVAGRNLYTWVRHANSGAANYESSDMIQYIYTVANLAAHIEVLRRVLRLSYTFNSLNRYTYVADLVATEWTEANIAAIRLNLANYVAQLNRVIAKFNTFKIPKDMHFITRWKWMSSSVFKDDDLDKSTHYLFYPRSIAHYDWANHNVEFSSINFANTTFATYLTAIENEIESLISHEDIGIMIGDILKAYKAEGCMVTEPVSMGEVIDPYYSKEVLTQIRNATILDRPYNTNKVYLKQVAASTQLVYFEDHYAGTSPSTGFVGHPSTINIQAPAQAGTGGQIQFQPMLSLESDSPTSDEVIIATRLSNVLITNELVISSSGGSSTYYLGIESSGSEILTKCNIVSVNDNTSATTQFIVDDFGSTVEWTDSNSNSDMVEILRKLSLIARISYMPMKLHLHYTAVNNGNYSYEPFITYAGKNLISLSQTWLSNLHAGCVLSEFSIPMFKLLESN